MKFTTYTGSTYEIEDSRVRRINADSKKRADGDWINLLNNPKVVIGDSVEMVLAPLTGYGPDDDGFRSTTSTHTLRVTSAVVSIDE